MSGVTKASPILITGSGGFIGKNLRARLEAAGFENLLLFEKDTPKELLSEYCASAQFVFHLAGINRPENPAEFKAGNQDFTQELLQTLAAKGNRCPVLATSSTQAALENPYGQSKLGAEQALHSHGEETGAGIYLYRLPGVFGKWCRPAYNSVVATFCHNVAHGLPLEIRDPAFVLKAVYIDDVVDAFVSALSAPPAKNSEGFCEVSPVYEITLGELASTLQSFRDSRGDLTLPQGAGKLQSVLYSTYLSYIPKGEFAYPLKMNKDERGSFTEFLRLGDQGQVSVNISRPGIAKGNHWHDSKNEKFLVVKGRASIRMRRWGEDEIDEYTVSGDALTVVDIPTGYTHNITNIGDEELVTVMWANEPFNPEKPDTNFLPVDLQN